VHPDNNGENSDAQAHPNYCIDGTEGQKKIRYTLLANRLGFPADGKGDLPEDILRRYRQIILHSRCPDPFDEPRIDRLLSEMRAGEFVLIGADAEGSVQATALGLLQRGRKVCVVVDAVGSHNKTQGKLAFRKMNAKGARLVETRKLAGSSHLRGVGICRCRSCRSKEKKAEVRIAAEI
jgi:nicotinamidase-related amidase